LTSWQAALKIGFGAARFAEDAIEQAFGPVPYDTMNWRNEVLSRQGRYR
jgi:hypothetical protein